MPVRRPTMGSSSSDRFALRSDVESLREDMREDITSLRNEIASLRREGSGGLRWAVITALVAGTAIMTLFQVVR